MPASPSTDLAPPLVTLAGEGDRPFGPQPVPVAVDELARDWLPRAFARPC